MPRILAMPTSSLLLGATLCAAAAVALSTPATAVSLSVQRACMSDYMSYCSKHAVGSPSLRRCMSSAGPKLSGRCVNALVAAGEVSRTEVSRRAASVGR